MVEWLELLMFDLPFVLLAHGALGPWDEVIFLSIAAVFLVFMGISWVRSRAMEPEFEDAENTDDASDLSPDTPASASSPERFELK
jgi:hypothetical protein